jgi:hypothetical protein
LFVHNSERLKEILKTLSQKDKPPNNQLHEIEPFVRELHEYQGILNEPFVKLDEVLAAARLLVSVFKRSDPTLTDEANDAIRVFLSDACKKAKKSEQLTAMETISQALRNIGGTRTGHHDVVTRFLDYATGSAFRLRCMYEER